MNELAFTYSPSRTSQLPSSYTDTRLRADHKVGFSEHRPPHMHPGPGPGHWPQQVLNKSALSVHREVRQEGYSLDMESHAFPQSMKSQTTEELRKQVTIRNVKVKISSIWDFPGGSLVKNLPCNAGDSGPIPGQGTKIPRVLEKLSSCATMTEPMPCN